MLNVSEDHLDRYAGMAEYAAAKARFSRARACIVLNRDDAFYAPACAPRRTQDVSFGLESAAPRRRLRPGRRLDRARRTEADRAERMKLVGSHNAANAMATLHLRSDRRRAGTPVAGTAAFSGLPHRVEFVDAINGVSYYDDSKGHQRRRHARRVQGMGRKVAIILGGEGKGAGFFAAQGAGRAWARPSADRARCQN